MSQIITSIFDCLRFYRNVTSFVARFPSTGLFQVSPPVIPECFDSSLPTQFTGTVLFFTTQGGTKKVTIQGDVSKEELDFV